MDTSGTNNNNNNLAAHMQQLLQQQQQQGMAGSTPVPGNLGAAGPAGGLMMMGTETGLMNSSSNSSVQQAPALTAGSTAPAGAATIDMASVLAKIQALEREKAELHSSLATTQGRLSKLQEGKRAEMEQLMNSTITKWLEQLPTKDANSKDTLRAGLEKLVKDGNESGVWEVVACASSNWQNNVNQIEALTQEVNSYREKERQLQGGIFQSEPSRFAPVGLAGQKRSAPEGEGGGSGYPTMGMMAGGGDMWSELESIFAREGGIRGVDYSGQQASVGGAREAVQ